MGKLKESIGEALTIVGALFAFLGVRAIEITWTLVKLAVLAAILYGAALEIAGRAPEVWPEAEFTFGAAWAYGTGAFETVAEAWMAVAVAVLVLCAWQLSRAARDIERSTNMNRIALVSILNYLEVEVETEGMKVLREEGWANFLKTSWQQKVAALFLGDEMLTDDRLTSRPKRHQVDVSLLTDIEDLLGAALRTHTDQR